MLASNKEEFTLKKIEKSYTLKEIVNKEFKVEVVFETTWKIFRLVLLLLTFVIFLYFFRFQFATSSSMYPTINTNDYMMFKNGNDNINRGDIVSFVNPYGKKETYVKRIIGLPKETIEIKGEKIYINSIPLENESYVFIENNIYGYYEDVKPFKIPENSYYVLGDNRYNSVDSREFGVIEKNEIKGKLFFNIPFGKIIRF